MAEHATHVEGLAHHFVSMEQQKEAGMVGMWIFLLTEVMFFGGLFLAYTIYRTTYPEGFLYGSHLLNVTLGGTNTVVLIVSSLTMAMAVYYSQKGERKKLVGFLAITLALGAGLPGDQVLRVQSRRLKPIYFRRRNCIIPPRHNKTPTTECP